jgi:prepilin-type N-terminal cleavage/methylation domain-containing protein
MMSRRSISQRRSGFTIVELLTAMTVLTLLLLMVNQIVSTATMAMTMSGRHLDADTQARLLFNRMATDFSGMLKRTDVDYSTFKGLSSPQLGNDQLAFYSETHGYFSGATQPTGSGRGDLALVAYMIANDSTTSTPSLQRLGKGLGWEPDSGGSPSWSNAAYMPITLTARWPTLFNGDQDYRSVGNLVFRMEYTYLLKATSTSTATFSVVPYLPSHSSVNGLADVAAIVVTVAMLDNPGRAIVTNYTNLESNTLFVDTTSTAPVIPPTKAWNDTINSSTFATTAGIPQRAASYVRVYERYFYLDSSQ